ncbi:MAG: hypothetical protein IPP29_20100 [Bacteroidetes bacterium]|nr:hypothetical protein [Bacteroidota bacterium]
MKNDQIKVTIYVKEYKTEKPIANAIVSITRGDAYYGGHLVTTLTTNENGEAYYDEIVDMDFLYRVQARKDGYIDENQQSPISAGKKNQKQLLILYTESYVKLHVKNVNPFNQYDLIRFGIGCTALYFQGNNVDTTIAFCDNGFTFRGNFQYNYACIATKNNLDSIIYFSLVPKPNDTITVNINY